MLFWISFSHGFINVKGKIKLVPEIDLVCDWLLYTEKLFVTNRKPQLFVYTFKPVCRYIFKHLEANFRNLLGIELTNDLTLAFLSLVNNDLCFFVVVVTGVGCEIKCVKTTESNNVFYISVRVTCTIKFNIKENFKTWMFNFLDRSNYVL